MLSAAGETYQQLLEYLPGAYEALASGMALLALWLNYLTRRDHRWAVDSSTMTPLRVSLRSIREALDHAAEDEQAALNLWANTFEAHLSEVQELAEDVGRKQFRNAIQKMVGELTMLRGIGSEEERRDSESFRLTAQQRRHLDRARAAHQRALDLHQKARRRGGAK